MGKTYPLNPPILCSYGDKMRNLWDYPLQRLEIYCFPFQHPGGYFKVSKQASCNGHEWIGMERYLAVIEETIPFRILSQREIASLLLRNVRGRIEDLDVNACVLIDYLNIKPNYFHWFLDALPRILAVEAYRELTGDEYKIVVPQSMQPWQRASLQYMNVDPDQLIHIPPATPRQSWGFSRLISSFSHRHVRHSPTGHFDAFSPVAIQTLSNRLIENACRLSNWTSQRGKRLYISRGNATLRQVRNEDEVTRFLSRYNFECVQLDAMSLHHQIQIFHQATHIISAHGGALTNLMYISPGCRVLEIFQTGHGLRPDFFQLTALRQGLYSFGFAKSLNAKNDIDIPLDLLQSFLEASL